MEVFRRLSKKNFKKYSSIVISILLLVPSIVSLVTGCKVNEADGQPGSASTTTISPNRTPSQAIPILHPSTMEEASRLVGFTVVSPSFIPDTFNKYASIDVVNIGAKRVTLGWNSTTSNSHISLIQAPKMGLGKGEAITFAGVQGLRSYQPALNGAPAFFTLSWRKAEITYLLIATVGHDMDEPTLQKIAASVGSQ